MTNHKNFNLLSGSWFWLKWISVAIAGFVGSTYFWNWLLLNQVGINFKDPKIAFVWILIVFGTWFAILMFLMKKQESAMFQTQNEEETTISWWLVWIGMTIGSFFLAAWFWTPFLASRLGSIKESANALIWIVAVFGTWLIALTPLMIFMYRKVDQTYEKARIAKEKKSDGIQTIGNAKVKFIHVPHQKRILSKDVSMQLANQPFALENGHLVTVKLKNGKSIPNVFIQNRSELVGVYDQTELTFQASDVIAIELTDLNQTSNFTDKVWLRLDAAEV